MHIIAPTTYLSSKRGGLEKCLLDILKGLSTRGHQVSLVYQESGDQLEQYRQFCDQIIPITNYHLNLKFLPDVLKISATKDSIVYSNEYTNLFFSFVLSKLKGVPLVAHHHLHASVENNLLKVRKQSFTLNGIHSHLAVSNAVKQDWTDKLNINPDAINVVYNGINCSAYHTPGDANSIRNELNLSPNIKIVSYAGRLEEYKGLEILIKAFKLLLQTNIEAKLLIAGRSVVDGEGYEQHLKDLVAQLGIQDQVIFLGHISNTSVLYSSSDVVVVPSLWLEAFGLVVVESMICGTPVIASRIGGLPEILTGEFERFLFEPRNEKDLLRVLQQVIHWRKKTPELAEQCRNHIIQRFSLERMVDGVESALLDTLAKRQSNLTFNTL